MNRITQCLHGKGTVSAMMAEREGNGKRSPAYLAYSGMIRPVIFWNLTGMCNLSCTHCYNASGPGQDTRDELTTKEAQAFITDCGSLGVPVILLSGGEPLMRPDLFELAEYARGVGIRTALSSNGTLITPDIARKIHDAGIGYVGISLDGATAQTHDRFRGCSGAFEKAVQAFSYCRDAGVRCGVRVTLHKRNIHELDDLIDLSLRSGASRFCVYWLVPSGRGSDVYREIQLDGDQVFSALEILYRYAETTDPSVMEFLTVDGPQDAVHLLHLMERRGSADLAEAESLIASMKGGCSAGIRVASVSQTGDVYPCQFAQVPEFHVGSIRKTPFSALWNDPENLVLSRFRSKISSLTGRCAECQYLSLCGGGCRIRAYHESGTLCAPDPFCFIQP